MSTLTTIYFSLEKQPHQLQEAGVIALHTQSQLHVTSATWTSQEGKNLLQSDHLQAFCRRRVLCQVLAQCTDAELTISTCLKMITWQQACLLSQCQMHVCVALMFPVMCNYE